MPDIITGADFRRQQKRPASGAYLFFGEEEYTKRHCLETLRAQLCPDKQTAVFNHIRLSGADADFTFSALTDAYAALPFFGGDKLTEVHDISFSALREGEIKDLLAVLQGLCTYGGDGSDVRNVLVIYCLPDELEGGQPNRPTALLKKLSQTVQAVRFDRESSAHLMSWAGRHFTAAGILASPEICRSLIDRCGHSMFTIDNEIQKLSCYLHQNGRDRVTEADLETVSPRSAEIGAFDFANALMNCDPDGAYTVYADMKNRRERPELILGTVISTYDTLYRMKTAAECNRTPQEIAALFKLNETRVKIYLRACRNFSLSFLTRAVRACHDADIKIKTSALEPYAVIETLLANLTPKRRTGR